MREQLISFETAKLAKKKGFDWSVSWYATHKRKAPTNPDSFYPELSTFKNWNDDANLNFYDRYSLPTQSLLQKWLRDIHNIHINIDCNAGGWYYELMKCNGTTIYIEKGRNKGMAYQGFNYETYEEALEAGLQEALKLI